MFRRTFDSRKKIVLPLHARNKNSSSNSEYTNLCRLRNKPIYIRFKMPKTSHWILKDVGHNIKALIGHRK